MTEVVDWLADRFVWLDRSPFGEFVGSMLLGFVGMVVFVSAVLKAVYEEVEEDV